MNKTIIDNIKKIKEETLNHYRNSITRARYEEDVDKIETMVGLELSKQDPSKPDFVLIQELNEIFMPKQFGFVSAEEVKLISEKLELSCRSIMSLRNLRNTVVMLVNLREEEEGFNRILEMDRVGAIAQVIDDALFNYGVEP